MIGKVLSAVILALTTAIGAWAFLNPFFFPRRGASQMAFAHSEDAPFTFLLLVSLCLVVVIANLETRKMNSKMVAALGILTAINAILRLIPGPGGFSAMFFLPILCGYVYGADFGFLLGALSLLVSAIVTSGIGPWLPYQMFAAGWMGMASGWVPDLRRLGRLEVLALALWGGLAGLLFGAIMNLWFWPYLIDTSSDAGRAGMYWRPGLVAWDAVGRYALFYLTTSLAWDMGRAGGNFLLLLLFGGPILRLLRRFEKRFHFRFQEI